MRYILALLSLLAGCVSPLAESQDTPLATVSGNYVLVWSGVPGILGLTASAVIVADGLAVTNRHVAEASTQLAGNVAGYGMVGLNVIAVSDRMDLAVLALPRGIGAPLDMATPLAGSQLWLMGSPSIIDVTAKPVVSGPLVHGDTWACTQGIFAAPTPSAPCGGARVDRGLMVAASASAGYSGGPVVDEQGRVIGLTQGLFVTTYDGAGGPLAATGPLVFAYSMAAIVQEVHRLLSDKQVAWLVGDNSPVGD